MFRNHSKQAFIDHAFEYHPEAVAALSNIEDGSLSDINCPWTSELDSKEIKTESQNTNATEESSGEYFEYSMDLDYENYYYDEDDFDDYEPTAKKPRKYNKRNSKNSASATNHTKKENDIQDSTKQNDDNSKKTYTCGHCPKEFPTPSKLKRHVTQVHEGLKAFQCDRCDKAFGEMCKLKKHVTIVHEGVKNFQCEKCEYRCGQLSNLKKHISIVHEGNYLFHLLFVRLFDVPI